MGKFNIKPGIYVVPDFGRIDCNNEVSDKNQVQLYLNPHFRVFIDATQKGIALLKKEKLTEKQVAGSHLALCYRLSGRQPLHQWQSPPL